MCCRSITPFFPWGRADHLCCLEDPDPQPPLGQRRLQKGTAEPCVNAGHPAIAFLILLPYPARDAAAPAITRVFAAGAADFAAGAATSAAPDDAPDLRLFSEVCFKSLYTFLTQTF